MNPAEPAFVACPDSSTQYRDKSVDLPLPLAYLRRMASGKKNLNSLRKRIDDLLYIERSHMCWDLGHFQAPMFIQEAGGTPTKPYFLICIDTA